MPSAMCFFISSWRGPHPLTLVRLAKGSANRTDSDRCCRAAPAALKASLSIVFIEEAAHPLSCSFSFGSVWKIMTSDTYLPCRYMIQGVNLNSKRCAVRIRCM